ncbi:hypothetical protein TSAR_000858 [Trichomalopsis sarcophagae]|uniref:Uncharacterized protein n=1 Tax=Trichomalopsis sarcophagae TaxID=543379 RepID=A0A232EK00_9HYME|nr:hypothetical protein TSAR_000858 [Trichomalopsis sarcophagae]
MTFLPTIMTPHLSYDSLVLSGASLKNNSKMSSKTNVALTSPVSSLATNLQNNMNIKTPSPAQNRRQIKIKRRLNQICSQISEIKLSPPPQQQQHLQQHQQQSIDQNELDLFCQATTVKKGSKRAIEQPETLAPPTRNILNCESKGIVVILFLDVPKTDK